MMRHAAPLMLLFVVLFAPTASAQRKSVELTRDNPATLVSTDSRDYSVYGLRLGMTRAEVRRRLAASKVLRGERDEFNPSRIYVYYRDAGEGVTDSVLYLIWRPGQARLSHITVFAGFRESLADNFKRLLSREALDRSSAFMKSFAGLPNRAMVTLDVPSVELKNTTYYYDGIGLEITHVRSSGEENVVFALVEKRPAARRPRRR